MWIELKISYIHEKTAIKMVNVRDFTRFRFTLRDHGCGSERGFWQIVSVYVQFATRDDNNNDTK